MSKVESRERFHRSHEALVWQFQEFPSSKDTREIERLGHRVQGDCDGRLGRLLRRRRRASHAPAFGKAFHVPDEACWAKEILRERRRREGEARHGGHESCSLSVRSSSRPASPCQWLPKHETGSRSPLLRLHGDPSCCSEFLRQTGLHVAQEQQRIPVLG